MFGDPIAERMALETTYEDLADIERETVAADEYNIARKVLKPVEVGVICALSRGGDQSAQTEAQHNIRHDFKLFLPPETDVKAGDTVKVYRFGRIKEAGEPLTFEVIGLPLRYLTHTEATVKAVGLA